MPTTLTIFTLLLILILLMLGQENANRIAEWLTRLLAKQLPKRQERRLEEWLYHLDSLPRGYARLFAVFQFAMATFQAQEESPAILLLGWFLASFRIVTRIFCAYMIVSSPYWILTGIMDGKIHANDLPAGIFFLTYLAVGLQTDRIDFSWHPRITFNEKIILILTVTHIISLPLMLVFSSPLIKFIAVLIVVAYLLISWSTLKKIWNVHQKNRKANQ